MERNSINIDMKGPYRATSMVLGSYRYVTDEENNEFKDRVVKGENLAGDEDLSKIVALFSFGLSYGGDENIQGGNFLLPNVPTLDSMKIKVEDLDRPEVRSFYTSIITSFYNLNHLRNTDGDSERNVNLSDCLGNLYNRHVKKNYGFQPSVIKFDALDIRGMFSTNKEVSTYYQKEELDKFYEMNKTDLDTDSKFTVVVTRPMLSNRIGDIHVIKKLMITFYTPGVNPVALIMSVKELTASEIEELNSTKKFTHETI